VIGCGVCGSGVGDGDGGGGGAAEVLKGTLVGSCNSEGVSAEDAASGSTDEGGSVMVAAAASAASASASIARISGGLSRNSRSFRGASWAGAELACFGSGSSTHAQTGIAKSTSFGCGCRAAESPRALLSAAAAPMFSEDSAIGQCRTGTGG